jgi:hypothetical protein
MHQPATGRRTEVTNSCRQLQDELLVLNSIGVQQRFPAWQCPLLYGETQDRGDGLNMEDLPSSFLDSLRVARAYPRLIFKVGSLTVLPVLTSLSP